MPDNQAAGHYCGNHVEMVKVTRTVPTTVMHRREEGSRTIVTEQADGSKTTVTEPMFVDEPVTEDVEVVDEEPGLPTVVCIPADLVSIEADGTATIDVLDPTWPNGPQRRTGVLVGPLPMNGHSVFHYTADHV